MKASIEVLKVFFQGKSRLCVGFELDTLAFESKPLHTDLTKLPEKSELNRN